MTSFILNCLHRFVKRNFFSLSMVLIFFFSPLTDLKASANQWLIDTQLFGRSAHGQMSCRDCHSNIEDKSYHPDPAAIDSSSRSFFDTEICLECHDVMADIENKDHGKTPSDKEKASANCLLCHRAHYQLRVSEPAEAGQATGDIFVPSSEDKTCLDCHMLRSTEDELSSAICLPCHSKGGHEDFFSGSKTDLPLVPEGIQTHGNLSCLSCHRSSARYAHIDQERVECISCHTRHKASDIGDYHLNVSCQACHLKDGMLLRKKSGRIIFKSLSSQGKKTSVHDMKIIAKTESCSNCHWKGNDLGASAVVLPEKSIICMGCHPSNLMLSDTVSLLSVLLFGLGILFSFSIWFPTDMTVAGLTKRIFDSLGRVFKMIFSRKLFTLLKALILDGLFLKKLFLVSKSRWMIHGLIFYAFVIRFVWGIIGLFGSYVASNSDVIWILLDKNHPITAFIFDFTGMMVLLGGCLMMVSRKGQIRAYSADNLNMADWPALLLLAGIMLVGFMLEGMQIAMTGTPSGSECAFIGHGLSLILNALEMEGGYTVVWYLHAILTGCFLAYLPFSRMMHMIVIPVASIINVINDKKE